ncbi:MAG: redox-regulated ATPase YchF [Halobacteria archaeon]
MITVGLAGKPNAGKSTFYQAATMAEAETGNYPFTTIDANRGVTSVKTDCPCLELESRCGNCRKGKRYVPVELVDVAGLVPDAHLGKGLGNQFLDELRQADVIIHVVDAAGATNEKGEPVEPGDHDPVEDVDFLENEIDLWIAGILEENWEKLERRSKTPNFDFTEELAEILTGVGASEPEIQIALRKTDAPEFKDWNQDRIRNFASVMREISKPIITAANKAEIAPESNLEALKETANAVPTSAESELALRRAAEDGVVEYQPGDADFELSDEVNDRQRKGLERISDFMEENGGTGIQAVLDRSVYDVLDMITAYPVEDPGDWTDGSGNVLPDAFLLEKGSTPKDLAFEVHSDVGEGYIHAVDARKGQRTADDTVLEEGDVIKIESTA